MVAPERIVRSESAEWAVLERKSAFYAKDFRLNVAFTDDPDRVAGLSWSAPGLHADLSRNLWDAGLVSDLLALAERCDVAGLRDAMWEGEPINRTEARAVQHVHQRMAEHRGAGSPTAMMLEAAERIRGDACWTHLVHIGVGGSGLGPELCLQALCDAIETPIDIRVVGNVDGHDLHQALRGLDPTRTVFVVASKSWTTLETRLNAAKARAWLEQDGLARWEDHAVAVTAKPEKALADGYRQVLEMPESVGGRFSIWSAVGLPLAIALGSKGFEGFLDGAREMDEYFHSEPMTENLPVLLGLLDVWYATFLKMPSRCVVPYHHGLRRLPAYLQQLEMESNGKRVDVAGRALSGATAPAVWGEVGTNSQHAFFQWLHQGAQRIPVEFVLVARACHPWPDHQRWLHASALAQAKALMEGCQAGPGQLAGHEDFPGNRPSTVLVLDDLSPRRLGALLAMYEHRTFVAGAVWGINSFDQWGVELGKRLARTIEPALMGEAMDSLDPATARLVTRLRQLQATLD